MGKDAAIYFSCYDADGLCRNSRIETLMTYAQSVYLLFASVYVCKETVEHLLLSSGEGHHHHSGDEVQEFFGSVPRLDISTV